MCCATANNSSKSTKDKESARSIVTAILLCLIEKKKNQVSISSEKTKAMGLRTMLPCEIVLSKLNSFGHLFTIKLKDVSFLPSASNKKFTAKKKQKNNHLKDYEGSTSEIVAIFYTILIKKIIIFYINGFSN